MLKWWNERDRNYFYIDFLESLPNDVYAEYIDEAIGSLDEMQRHLHWLKYSEEREF